VDRNLATTMAADDPTIPAAHDLKGTAINLGPKYPDEQYVQVLREFHESEESLEFDLGLLLPNGRGPVKLDPLVRQHYGIMFVPQVPTSPISFEELKRRERYDSHVSDTEFFPNDFATYPVYAIRVKDDSDVSAFFSSRLQELLQETTDSVRPDEETKISDDIADLFDGEDDFFFNAFDSEFKTVKADIDIVTLTDRTYCSTDNEHFFNDTVNISAYQELEDVEDDDEDNNLFALDDDDESDQYERPLRDDLLILEKSSDTIVSSVTEYSRDSSESRYYDTNWNYQPNSAAQLYDTMYSNNEDHLDNSVRDLIAKARLLLQQQIAVAPDDDKKGSKDQHVRDSIETSEHYSESHGPSAVNTSTSSQTSSFIIGAEGEIDVVSDISKNSTSLVPDDAKKRTVHTMVSKLHQESMRRKDRINKRVSGHPS